MVHSTLQAQGTPLAAPELDRLLEQLLEQRLVMEDGGRYLSLALPVRPPR